MPSGGRTKMLEIFTHQQALKNEEKQQQSCLLYQLLEQRKLNSKANKRGLVTRHSRLEVRKPAQHGSLQELEMRDLCGEFLNASLAAGNLGRETVLMGVTEPLAFEVFVGAVSKGPGGAREHVFDPSIEACLFLLCRM